MEPIILAGARKHDIADEDILHAYRNPIRVSEQDDATMIVGPARDGRLLEVGAVTGVNVAGFLIVHAMPAPIKYLR